MGSNTFMRRAIELSFEAIRQGRGGPFGAVVARDGLILATGSNQVLSTNDPTAHAEIVAIRSACRAIGSYRLAGCELYTSCEPCPMCLGAILWSRLDRVYYGNTREDAARIGFDDAEFYEQMSVPLSRRGIPFLRLLCDEARLAFEEWNRMEDKRLY